MRESPTRISPSSTQMRKFPALEFDRKGADG
jgi:hypothetical protein